MNKSNERKRSKNNEYGANKGDVSKRAKEEDHEKDESQQSSNEESQECRDLDDDPTSDSGLPNELSDEINGLNTDELSIRDTLLEILHQYRSKDVESDKTLLSSNFINGVIDITNVNVKKIVQSKLSELNEGQQWFDQVLNKKTWTPTSEFINYCNQFTDDTCNRVEFPTLVRKSFVIGRFDPFVHEGHDIVQDIMKHFSVRLEAPSNINSKVWKLERTYAVDTIIYVMNRLFRMHQDVMDGNWIEILTADTKSHKFDGVWKAFQIKKNRQTIILIEFSFGQYASMDKDTEDKVKLCRNAKRILNKLLDKVPCKNARVYTIQSVNGMINIKYMVRPLPSIYLYDEFVSFKTPTNFNDMEQFTKDVATLMDFQTDVLWAVKLMNKKITEDKKVYKSKVKTTPEKKKVTKEITPSHPESPSPGTPNSPLI